MRPPLQWLRRYCDRVCGGLCAAVQYDLALACDKARDDFDDEQERNKLNANSAVGPNGPGGVPPLQLANTRSVGRLDHGRTGSVSSVDQTPVDRSVGRRRY